MKTPTCLILPAALWLTLSLPCQAGKIHDAVSKRDLAALDRALKREPRQVNARCYPDFDTPLYMAVAAGDPAIVKRLLDAGADAAMPSAGPERLTPVQRAVTLTREEKMGELPEIRVDPVVLGDIVPSKESGKPTATAQPRSIRPFPPLPAEEKQARMQVLELLVGIKPAIRNGSPNGVPPLHIAAGLGDANVVKLLVDAGEDVNGKCPAWMSSLHYAALGNADREVFDLLVAKGADVDAADNKGRTPLMLAARLGNAGGVEALIAAGAALDAEDIHRQSVICHAAVGGDEALVKLIYQKGGRDIIRFAKPEVLFQTAAAAGGMALAEILLAEGVDVNIRDEAGFTPLLSALERDHRELAAFLLGKGAERDAKTKDGRGMINIACLVGNTPLVREFVASDKADKALSILLSHAAARGRLEIVRLLVENGVNVNAPGPDRDSPLLRAVAGDSVPSAIPDPNPPSEDDRAEIVELLIKNGAKVDVEPYAGMTWMHAGVPYRGARVIKALLKAGVQPDLPAGSKDRTPLHIAAMSGRVETVQLLLDAGADPKKLDRQGDGLLLIAAAGGHAELVSFLIAKHFPVNVKNPVHGGTPLHCAAIANSPECVRLLLAAGASVNSQDVGGGTPLSQAIDKLSRLEFLKSDRTPERERMTKMANNLKDRLRIIHLLLEAGARTDMEIDPARSGNFIKLAQFAKDNGTPEIVELLENPPAVARKPRKP
jgi:ankyrin repeat protein